MSIDPAVVNWLCTSARSLQKRVEYLEAKTKRTCISVYSALGEPGPYVPSPLPQCEQEAAEEKVEMTEQMTAFTKECEQETADEKAKRDRQLRADAWPFVPHGCWTPLFMEDLFVAATVPVRSAQPAATTPSATATPPELARSASPRAVRSAPPPAMTPSATATPSVHVGRASSSLAMTPSAMAKPEPLAPVRSAPKPATTPSVTETPSVLVGRAPSSATTTSAIAQPLEPVRIAPPPTTTQYEQQQEDFLRELEDWDSGCDGYTSEEDDS